MPTRKNFVILRRSAKNDKLGVVSQTVGANCVRPPNCHSEPLGEESRFVLFYFVLLEILRFAQDDKLGFVGVFNGIKFPW